MQKPHYHFTPPRDWMNDPNGLVYFNNQWHLFFQWRPKEATGIWWGHAVSDNLIDWRYLPGAIAPDELGEIWSGSAVVDHRDTSGFFGGEAGMVAIWTYRTEEYQAQGIAYSRDGIEWTKYEGNPVLRSPSPDFRDPKVFWHEASTQWVMIVSCSRVLQFYTSPDLKNWTLKSEWGEAENVTGTIWECPDLFPMPVNDDDSDTKWVLIGSRIGDGACDTFYFVGDFDGEKFTALQSPKRLGGPDDYAAVSWSDAPPTFDAPEGRRVIIGWMNHWGYAHSVPHTTWQGQMTLPRELKLRRDENGYTLLQNPVREVETLRGASHDLKNFASDGCELLGAWNVSTHNARCGFRVLSGDGEETLIGYENGAIFLDRTRAGQSDFNAHFARRYEMPLSQNGEIKLRVFVDRNGVEVFANDGEAMLSALVFPANEKLQIEAWSENAELWEARAFELRDAKMENAACCDPQ